MTSSMLDFLALDPIEAFVVCVGNAGFEAVAITFAHVGFELEEGF